MTEDYLNLSEWFVRFLRGHIHEIQLQAWYDFVIVDVILSLQCLNFTSQVHTEVSA
jgi:hypothetical protein